MGDRGLQTSSHEPDVDLQRLAKFRKVAKRHKIEDFFVGT